MNLRVYGNKAERVYDTLKAEFVRGGWPFGHAFSTYELAERFGVSRRPIMDALQRLEAAGFVEIIPQVGCRVVLPEESRIRDNFELSLILEGPAARLAAQRATDADVEELGRIHTRAAPIVRARDGASYPPVNREFHAAILELAGNQALAVAAASAWDLREFYFNPYQVPILNDVLSERHADHARILEAIRNRDGAAAQALMEAHLDPDYGLEMARRARQAEQPASQAATRSSSGRRNRTA